MMQLWQLQYLASQMWFIAAVLFPTTGETSVIRLIAMAFCIANGIMLAYFSMRGMKDESNFEKRLNTMIAEVIVERNKGEK